MKSTPSVSSQRQTDAYQPTAIEDLQVVSSFWTAAFLCSLAGIFILYSRFFDLAANGYKIPRIVLSLMILFFAISGRAFTFLKPFTGKVMLAFLFWVSFTLIFSVWKGGSLPPYLQLLQSTVIFAIAAGLPVAVRNVRRIMGVLAISGLVAALMSVPWGADQLGRLALREGSYLDPNYYALALLAVVPLFWGMAASAESLLGKLFAWLGLVPVVIALARTGSRGAMIGFAAMLLVLFVISPVKTKVLLVAASTFGLAAVLAAMPDYLRARYLTFLEVDSAKTAPADPQDGGMIDLNRLKADASSADNRKRLLFTSIDLTFRNPLVGVGPGNFPTAVYEESKASGRVRNEWLVTHNSYTQISSETGFPGFFLFVLILLSSFKNLSSVLKNSKPEGRKPDPEAYTAAKYLLLSLSAVSLSIFFLAVGYEFTIFALAGLTAGLRRTFEQQPEAVDEAAGEERSLPAAVTAFTTAAYAKAEAPASKRETPMVSGRAVRFGRFR